MAKQSKQSAKTIATKTIAKAAKPVAPAPVEAAPVETKKQRASRVAGGLKRLGDLVTTRNHNKAVLTDTAGKPVKADIGATDKGANPKRQRVYGYDNTSSTWGVPKAAKIVIVPGATLPRAVAADQWELLQKFAGKPVQEAYDNKVSSRTVRRAFRGGAIRFQQA